eukprot:scaffold77801_cov75-Phaeocystis_antarctica.AAC.1
MTHKKYIHRPTLARLYMFGSSTHAPQVQISRGGLSLGPASPPGSTRNRLFLHGQVPSECGASVISL